MAFDVCVKSRCMRELLLSLKIKGRKEKNGKNQSVADVSIQNNKCILTFHSISTPKKNINCPAFI